MSSKNAHLILLLWSSKHLPFLNTKNNLCLVVYILSFKKTKYDIIQILYIEKNTA